MAAPKPPTNLYTGDAVVVDAMPYVRYADQLKAKRQAREESLDKYYQNFPNTINEKGVRDVDIEPIHQAKDQLQAYWMQNREAIRKGNTPAAFNYGKMMREIMGKVQLSKNNTVTSTKLADMKKTNPYLFKGAERFEKQRKHGLSVFDPEYQPIDLLEFENIKPLDQKKLIGGISHIKPSAQKISYEDIPGDKYNRTVITDYKFTEKDLNSVHNYAQTEFDNNPSFEREVRENIQSNPARAAEMSKLFQDNFGHQIRDEGDLAAAYVLSLMELKQDRKVAPIFENREALRNSNISSRSKSGGSGSGEVTINNVYAGIVEALKDPQKAIFRKGTKEQLGTKFNALNADAQEVIMKYVNGNRADKLNPEDLFIKDDNGKIKVYKKTDAFATRNKDGSIMRETLGQPLVENKEGNLVYELPFIAANLGKQADVKGKRAVVAEGNTKNTSSYSIKGKKYTEKELLDMGYSVEQIQPYKQK